MNNNFEKQVRKQGNQFNVKPSNGVWRRIEAELDQKKKPRIISWWWAAPLLLLVGASLFWIYGHLIPNNNHNNTVETNKLPDTQKIAESEINDPKSLVTDLASTQTPAEIEIMEQEFEAKPSITLENLKKQDINKKNFKPRAAKISTSGLFIQQSESANSNNSSTNTNKPRVFLPALTTQNKVTKANTEAPTVLEPHFFHENRQSQTHTSLATWVAPKNYPVVNASQPEALSQSDSLYNTTHSANIYPEEPVQQNLTQPAANIANLFKPTTQSITPALAVSTKKISASKKVNWLLTVSVGLSNLYLGSSLFKPFDVNPQEYAFGNGLNAGNTNSTPFRSFKTNKASLSFGTGIAYQLPLSKRWLLHNELNYQYLSIQQFSGNRKDSTVTTESVANINDSEKNLISNFFYYPGNSNKHLGTNHRISLHSGFVYQLINQKYKLGIGCEVYLSTNIQHNYLALDYQHQRFIPSANKQKTLSAGTALKLHFVTPKKWQYGLKFLNDFTAAHPTFGGKKSYWRSLQASFSIPLKK